MFADIKKVRLTCTYIPKLFHGVTTMFTDIKQLVKIHVYIHIIHIPD